jgi:hypothetical protein
VISRETHDRLIANYATLPKTQVYMKTPTLVRYDAKKSALIRTTLVSIDDDAQLEDYWRMLLRYFETRVFEFSEQDYIDFHHAADVFVTKLSGHEWEMPKPLGSEEEIEMIKQGREYSSTCYKEGAKVPFPEHLPFPAIYLGWGGGVGVSNNIAGHDHYIIGTLVYNTGYAIDILREVKAGVGQTVVSNIKTLIVVQRTPEIGWLDPYTLAPWIVNEAVAAINECDTLVAEPKTLRTKREWREGAGNVPMPKAFYPVTIHPSTITEKIATLTKRRIEWSHRWGVRGHYLAKIYRGNVPIEPDLLAMLQRNKYAFYGALHPVAADELAFLVKRGIPTPTETEWLAFKRTWRNDFIKGPEGKPFVPSVHRISKKEASSGGLSQ